MHAFNFFPEEEDKELLSDGLLKVQKESSTFLEESCRIKICIEISPPTFDLKTNSEHESITIDGICIKFTSSSGMNKYDVYDIIPKEYEGGYKVWESSIDLAECLIDKYGNCSNKKPMKVLELGCGQGLPGCTAMKLGFESVVFSDYNEDVIEQVTWRNIIMNHDWTSTDLSSIKCYSGDWISLSEVLRSSRNDKFSLILSAETLYTSECAEKVFYMILKHLELGGIALLATKRFYFGVGGGTMKIEDLARSCDQVDFEVVRSIDDGFSNIRDIVQITLHHCIPEIQSATVG